ncbi:20366_t:CDS:1, partial [Racocetra persica]
KVPVGTTFDESSSDVSQSFGQATEISDASNATDVMGKES